LNSVRPTSEATEQQADFCRWAVLAAGKLLSL